MNPSSMTNVPLSYICEGCLCVDRKLTTIYDEEYKKVFTGMLDFMDQTNQEWLLCWECTAKIRSVIHFKKRVRAARDHLLRFMVYQTTPIASLSNLKTIVNAAQDYYYQDKEDKTLISSGNEISTTNFGCDSAPNINFINIDEPNISNVATSTETQFTESNNVVSEIRDTNENESQSSFIIKIEDNDFDNERFDGDENNSLIDDKDDVTEAKIDNVPIAQESARTKKKRKKKRKKEEFNASDDEPLKPSKKEKKDQMKDKSLEKEDTDDKAVKKRRKREKPAGVVNNPRVDRNLAQLNVKDGQVEMIVLSWEEVEAERQRARESIVFTRHEYRCEDCVLGFNHRFKLDNHMTKHAPSAGPAECPVCHVRCRDDHALVAHKRRHRVRWRCVECGELWSRAAVAADHAARAHGAAPTHTCRRCGLTLQSLAKLRNHMKNHAERQKCELCGKTFRDRSSLRTHLFIHSGEKEYSCPHCDKRFLFKKAMEVHLVTHAAPAQLYCLECDMTFKNRMSYYQHKKYNLKHIDPEKLKYKCPLCDKKFLKAARLEEHNFAVHLKVTPIRCTMPDCDFACSSRPVLRTHIRMVHRNLRFVRNHVCDTCGKAYTTKKTLEGHMRSHTGERPFHCGLCSSTFSYEAALYNHNKLVHLKGKATRRAEWEVGANAT
ncbi:zinc finger protein 485-like isoform X2 [Cydia pomonella]|uniref:zinc finger protein 485-like isoform X2 n=1 Tax=Cydia pomonella TaxID=82600 RepID=UPI002ADE2C9E|nr:zinc finger protein 485-like isoform X2 [Cydia pomonella]